MITGRRSQRVPRPGRGHLDAAARARSSYADLLDVVGALRAVPAPVPDPAFVLALRERLLEEAETVLVAAAAERADDRRAAPAASGAPARPPPQPPARGRDQRRDPRRRLRRPWPSPPRRALPGDRLYPLKRGLESAHAQLTFDRAARGRVLLDNASTRLDEVAELSRDGREPDQVGQTLDAFTQESIDGSDLLIADYQATGDRSSITTVRTFTAAASSTMALFTLSDYVLLVIALSGRGARGEIDLHRCGDAIEPDRIDACTTVEDIVAGVADDRVVEIRTDCVLDIARVSLPCPEAVPLTRLTVTAAATPLNLTVSMPAPPSMTLLPAPPMNMSFRLEPTAFSTFSRVSLPCPAAQCQC